MLSFQFSLTTLNMSLLFTKHVTRFHLEFQIELFFNPKNEIRSFFVKTREKLKNESMNMTFHKCTPSTRTYNKNTNNVHQTK